MIAMSKAIGNYFFRLEKEINRSYDLANNARKKGYDPEDFVDIPLAQNMIERVVGLIAIAAPQIKGK